MVKHTLVAHIITATLVACVAGTAYAIPLPGAYSLNNQFVSGTFTSDGNKLTDWNFTTTPSSVTYTPTLAGFIPVEANNAFTFAQSRRGNGHDRIDFYWLDKAPTIATLFARVDDVDFPGQVNVDVSPIAATVPEPTTMLLLGSGLLGLAGYRWHQRRREGTQLG